MTSNTEKRHRFDRVKIRVGYTCNNDCLVCDCRSLRKISDATRKQVAERIMLAGQKGVKLVIFTGGEPTIRKELPIWIALAKRLGLATGLISNGRALRFPDYTRRLAGEGLRFVQLTLFADEAELHDELVGGKPGAFVESWAGLEVCHELGLDLRVNLVLTRPSLGRLIALADKLMAFAPLEYRVSLVKPRKLEADAFERLVPTLDEASAKVREWLAYVANHPQRPEGFRVSVAGLPLCALPGHIDASADLRLEELAEMSESYESTFHQPGIFGRTKPERCTPCRFVENCPGVDEDYLAVRGESELKPELHAVSNSFAYEPLRFHRDFDVATCPILAGKLALEDPPRSLLVQEDQGVREYRTDSRDFSGDQIRLVKQELGQIYQDVSGKLFHENFELDLAKLTVHPVCRTCIKMADDCAGLYVQAQENVFSVAERELLEIVVGLRGRVLDVGGGPVRYRDQFASAMDRGVMDYWLVEPNPSPVLYEFLDDYNLRDHLFKGCIEDFRADNERFDWILVLRSHNHLYDLERAYRHMADWLKPGGRLFVVDNTAFGVVRSRELWERIRVEGGFPHFEHFNNHTSAEAVAVIEAAGFHCLEQHPVEPTSANQWWCLFKRK